VLTFDSGASSGKLIKSKEQAAGFRALAQHAGQFLGGDSARRPAVLSFVVAEDFGVGAANHVRLGGGQQPHRNLGPSIVIIKGHCSAEGTSCRVD
jgi:hypothetical protein